MYLGARSGFAMLYRRYISPGISASVVNMTELHCSVKSSVMSGQVVLVQFQHRGWLRTSLACIPHHSWVEFEISSGLMPCQSGYEVTQEVITTNMIF